MIDQIKRDHAECLRMRGKPRLKALPAIMEKSSIDALNKMINDLDTSKFNGSESDYMRYIGCLVMDKERR